SLSLTSKLIYYHREISGTLYAVEHPRNKKGDGGRCARWYDKNCSFQNRGFLPNLGVTSIQR
ncbi:4323_t:CDS:1, partial [Acaulospora morrowiae]